MEKSQSAGPFFLIPSLAFVAGTFKFKMRPPALCLISLLIRTASSSFDIAVELVLGLSGAENYHLAVVAEDYSPAEAG